ncbi:hypothetical protein R1flu_015300 [Riccia fluitans]|uniref:Uncharacterized protein n=1 Tax=Riccia fluitans TaxID=41844 RepID=A0ABD1YJM8_9MARC
MERRAKITSREETEERAMKYLLTCIYLSTKGRVKLLPGKREVGGGSKQIQSVVGEGKQYRPKVREILVVLSWCWTLLVSLVADVEAEKGERRKETRGKTRSSSACAGKLLAGWAACLAGLLADLTYNWVVIS